MRSEIARLLDWPENRVRIKVPYLGGGYGGKLYIKLEALVTALPMIARRPVKIALTMEEQFYQITKHPATVRIKSAVDKAGRITARKCEVYWNGGALRISVRALRTNPDSPLPVPTTSRTSRSIPTRSTPI